MTQNFAFRNDLSTCRPSDALPTNFCVASLHQQHRHRAPRCGTALIPCDFKYFHLGASRTECVHVGSWLPPCSASLIGPRASSLSGVHDREERVVHRHSVSELVLQAGKLGRSAPRPWRVSHIVSDETDREGTASRGAARAGVKRQHAATTRTSRIISRGVAVVWSHCRHSNRADPHWNATASPGSSAQPKTVWPPAATRGV